MAVIKTFNEAYIEAKNTVYSNSVNALILAAKNVPGVRFEPAFAPNGKVDGTSSQYNIQRRKRPTVNTVANANVGTTAAAMAALDQFTVNDWTTLPVATGALRSVGFREQLGDDFNFSDSPQHERDMYYKVREVAVQRHKDILALLGTAPDTLAALPAYVKGDTKVSGAIVAETIKLAAKDDEYMDVQALSDFYIVMSNTAAAEVKDEIGIAFNNEAPIAQTGMTSGMSINGIPVIVDQRLTGREVFIAHNEAIAFGSQKFKDVNVDLGLTGYTGRYFWDVMTIVDDARVVKFKAAP